MNIERAESLHVTVGVVLSNDFVDVPFRDVDYWADVSRMIRVWLLWALKFGLCGQRSLTFYRYRIIPDKLFTPCQVLLISDVVETCTGPY